MKQTSINYLWKALIQNEFSTFDDAIKSLEQAKAMHKEEQRLTYEGVAQNLGTSIKESDIPTFEEYYNKTFNTKEK